MPEFIAMMLQIIFLITLAGVCNVIAKYIKIPYTVLLFIVGLCLVPLSQLPPFTFLSSFSLNPDLLFYVFLPILLFESAYNMHSIEVMENRWSTWTLATVGLLISTICITAIGYGAFSLLGIDIPRQVVLLFAVIIGTTDPVAVMALFKEYGAPKRLQFIFEGESCFNDGTGLAMFLVVYEILRSGIFSVGSIGIGFVQFALMVIGGIGLGYLMAYIFSFVLKYIKNNEPVEILLTVVMAHLTFILADLIGHYVHIGPMELKISGVIATVFAGIVMGNYGRTKISPKVEDYMHKFRGFFGFCANSLVFILIGLIGATITAPLSEIRLPIVILVLSVSIARAISVYIPLAFINKLKLEDRIPLSRQHLLAWGSLRGALAFMIALLIADDFTIAGRPFDFSIKEFITATIIAKIAYTLFFKATTIPLLIKSLNIGGQTSKDTFQLYESKILVFHRILDKLAHMKQHYQISSHIVEDLTTKYQTYLKDTLVSMKEFVAKENPSDAITQSLGLHALGIEREYLNTMYHYNEVPEQVYVSMVHKFDHQIHRLEKGISQVKPVSYIEDEYLQKKIDTITSRGNQYVVNKYMQYRAQNISSYKVLDYLESLKKLDLGYSSHYIDDLIDLYSYFIELGSKKMNLLYQSHKTLIDPIDHKLYEKGLLKFEEGYIDELLHKNIISHKLYEEFNSIIDKNLEEISDKNIQVV